MWFHMADNFYTLQFQETMSRDGMGFLSWNGNTQTLVLHIDNYVFKKSSLLLQAAARMPLEWPDWRASHVCRDQVKKNIDYLIIFYTNEVYILNKLDPSYYWSVFLRSRLVDMAKELEEDERNKKKREMVVQESKGL